MGTHAKSIEGFPISMFMAKVGVSFTSSCIAPASLPDIYLLGLMDSELYIGGRRFPTPAIDATTNFRPPVHPEMAVAALAPA